MLIQPILAYGDGVPEYQIFTGFYDWHDGQWQQSQVAPVTPGQVLVGSVTWDAATGTYSQSIARKGSKPITTRVTKAQEHGEVFTDVYVVVEHQPNVCSEYPSNNNVTFTDIQIAWESGAPLTLSSWTVAAYKPACKSIATALAADKIMLSWASA